MLRTAFVERWLAEEARGSEERSDEPQIGATKIAGHAVPLVRFDGVPPTPDASGDLESMDFLMGQSAGLVTEAKPAADVVRELVSDARRLLAELAPLSR